MSSVVLRTLRALIAGFVILALIYLILPTIVVVPLSLSGQEYLSFPPQNFSLRWYERMASNPAWMNALLNSLLIAIPTALLSVILGTMSALAVARGDLRQAGLIAAVVVAPMMLPHVILAIGLYPIMLDLGLLRSHVAAILAHTVVGIPLVFVTVSASLKSYSSALELAAMTLGANMWQTFWQVTLPMILPGVVVGGILAFASSFDELMLSLFLTGATTRTLPRLMWEQMADFLTPAIAAAATLVFLFSLALLATVALIQRSAEARGGRHG